MQIAHEEIDQLASMMEHPWRRVFTTIVKEKIDQLAVTIDNLETKKKESSFNNTEVTILRKSFLRELIELPNAVTASFIADKNIEQANLRLKQYVDDLVGD